MKVGVDSYSVDMKQIVEIASGLDVILFYLTIKFIMDLTSTATLLHYWNLPVALWKISVWVYWVQFQPL